MYADARLSLRYNREKESNHVNILAQKFCCEFLCYNCVIQHNRNNGMLAGLYIKSRLSQFVPEIVRVPLQFITQLGCFTEHIQYCDGGTCYGWGQCIAKQVGS